jgi:hypothetical protein
MLNERTTGLSQPSAIGLRTQPEGGFDKLNAARFEFEKFNLLNWRSAISAREVRRVIAEERRINHGKGFAVAENCRLCGTWTRKPGKARALQGKPTGESRPSASNRREADASLRQCDAQSLRCAIAQRREQSQ